MGAFIHGAPCPSPLLSLKAFTPAIGHPFVSLRCFRPKRCSRVCMALEPMVVEKLERTEKAYKALTVQMSDPNIAGNATEFQKVARAAAELEDQVSAYDKYKASQAALKEAKELLRESEGDPEMAELAKEEIEGLNGELMRLTSQLKVLLLPKDPLDEKNIMLEIRAGTGGEEAALFAGDLLRMYQRYADGQSWKISHLSESAAENGGLKEAIVQVDLQGRSGTNMR